MLERYWTFWWEQHRNTQCLVMDIMDYHYCIVLSSLWVLLLGTSSACMVEVYLFLATDDVIWDTKTGGLRQYHWISCFPTTQKNRLIQWRWLSTLPMQSEWLFPSVVWVWVCFLFVCLLLFGWVFLLCFWFFFLIPISTVASYIFSRVMQWKQINHEVSSGFCFFFLIKMTTFVFNILLAREKSLLKDKRKIVLVPHLDKVGLLLLYFIWKVSEC